MLYFWVIMAVFVTLCAMRWDHCLDWRFYVYLPIELVINLFVWPIQIVMVFVHYKKTIPTKLYPVRG